MRAGAAPPPRVTADCHPYMCRDRFCRAERAAALWRARPRRRAHGQSALAAAKGTVEGSAADYGEGVESATRAALLVEKIRQARPRTMTPS